ncbi:UDP-N-acetylmuramoyl-tripeptide--D-alanyl-D-alanine ligase [Oceanobacillus sp. Castelsardo]|uniref:UDP-N-acetylmuramoyl-tripeptide--D-alanyl-D- alanine ligase n=1 Tax=Oceanobacillus sp. Castelsardo TaxID=1851204 RepID=UPI0008392EE6|nr:UDP-N-acetylmuramoyl-tripeptide--D-alanyl-D-alanine ligase [Oceanobacillus sp. Castelsardo]
MLFTLKDLSKWFPKNQGSINKEIGIKEITTDSRKETKNSLFIPIVGENFDGHQFVEQAVKNGAVALFWNKDQKLPSTLPKDLPVFLVEDTLHSLQKLAVFYRNQINPIVIGITGSNGKTTTKDLVTAVVKSNYITHSTKGNFNNHIGLPLTILSMNRDTEVLILEMGMSNFGEIDLLSKIARPNFAIITNIGESHIEFLGSREGIANAKMEIINGLEKDGTIIIDGDEELLESLHQKSKVIKCGFKESNDFIIEDAKVTLKDTIFTLSDGATYHIPLLGKHHAKNACFAIALADCLEIDIKERRRALQSVQHTSMRFELLKGKNEVSIINDAYNASPTSMKAAIEVVKEMDGFMDKVLILGDVLELGQLSESLHETIAEVIEAPISVLFTFGSMSKVISNKVKEDKGNKIKTAHFDSKEKLLEALQPFLNNQSLVLFKASRGLKFETFVNELVN